MNKTASNSLLLISAFLVVGYPCFFFGVKYAENRFNKSLLYHGEVALKRFDNVNEAAIKSLALSVRRNSFTLSEHPVHVVFYLISCVLFCKLCWKLPVRLATLRRDRERSEKSR